MDDPSSFEAGGMGAVATLGAAYIGALFVAGGSEKASLVRLMSYLIVSFLWAVTAAAVMTHVFDTKGLLMWALVPTAFAICGALVAVFAVSRNAWQRSPAEHHRSAS